MERFTRLIDACSKAGAYLSAFFMFIIVGLILIEIVLRSVFGFSTLIADEYSGYFMVAVVVSGLAWTFREDEHIKITVVTGRLGPKTAAVLEVIAASIALFLGVLVFRHAVIMVYDTWSLGMRADSISETPTWIPQVIIPFGLLVLNLQLVARIARRLPLSRTR